MTQNVCWIAILIKQNLQRTDSRYEYVDVIDVDSVGLPLWFHS